MEKFMKYVNENSENKDFQHLLFLNLLSRKNKKRIYKPNEEQFLEVLSKQEIFAKNHFREIYFRWLFHNLDRIEIISFYDRNILLAIVSYALRFEKNYFHYVLRMEEFLKNKDSFFPFNLLDKYFVDTWACVQKESVYRFQCQG
jgi:hypothetical protein